VQVFFMQACGSAGAGRELARADCGLMWVVPLRAHYLGPSRIFSADRPDGSDPNCHPYIKLVFIS